MSFKPFIKSLILIVSLPLPIFGYAAGDSSLPIEIDAIATLERESKVRVDDYRFALDSVVTINRTVRIDNEMRLSGELFRTTWEFPKSFEPDQILDRLRNQIVKLGGDLLFECDGRDCGPSNIWANDLFQNPDLVGRDDHQRYLAVQLNDRFLALYAVRHGNRRVYLNVDHIAQDQDSSGWLALLESRGWVKLPDERASTLNQLADFLTSTSMAIHVVAHESGRDVGIAQSKSEQRAARVKTALIDAGVLSRNIESFGLGALAPSVLGADNSAVVVIDAD